MTATCARPRSSRSLPPGAIAARYPTARAGSRSPCGWCWATGVWRCRSASKAPGALLRLGPGLRLVEGAQVPPDLELGAFGPDLRPVHFAVLGIQNGAALVVSAVGHQILDDDEAHDRLVLVRPLALGADLGLAFVVVGLGQADDLAVDLAALIVDLHLGLHLACLVVDGVPVAERRVGGGRHRHGEPERERRHDSPHEYPCLHHGTLPVAAIHYRHGQRYIDQRVLGA